MRCIEIKKGASFVVQVQASLNKQVTNIAGWTIRSCIFFGDELVEELVPTVTDEATGRFSLTALDSSAWPEGTLTLDIQYLLPGGFKHRTPDLAIHCKPGRAYP